MIHPHYHDTLSKMRRQGNVCLISFMVHFSIPAFGALPHPCQYTSAFGEIGVDSFHFKNVCQALLVKLSLKIGDFFLKGHGRCRIRCLFGQFRMKCLPFFIESCSLSSIPAPTELRESQIWPKACSSPFLRGLNHFSGFMLTFPAISLILPFTYCSLPSASFHDISPVGFQLD